MSYSTITLRQLVGNTLVEAGKKHPELIVLDSDLAKSTTTDKFQEAFPERFVELGIAEQNAMAAAAGLAAEAKIPFYVNFAMFVSGTCFTQLRQICYANLNVKLIATHPGMDGSFDGASHHANEDIALMRALPNLVVLSPSNPGELAKAVDLAIRHTGPVYIRTARDIVPDVRLQPEVEIAKAYIREDSGNDFAIIYEGSTAHLANLSYEKCLESGLKGKLVHVFSIKPLDQELLLAIAKKVKRMVSIENHSILGGLGSEVSEVISTLPAHAPLFRIGVQDIFTESGSLSAVKEKYGLTVENVVSQLTKTLD